MNDQSVTCPLLGQEYKKNQCNMPYLREENLAVLKERCCVSGNGCKKCVFTAIRLYYPKKNYWNINVAKAYSHRERLSMQKGKPETIQEIKMIDRAIWIAIKRYVVVSFAKKLIVSIWGLFRKLRVGAKKVYQHP